MDRVEVRECVARRAAEAQPVVRRHDVEGDGAGFGRHAPMLGRVGETLANNRRDDRQASTELVGDNARHRGALRRGEREHLAGVAVGHYRDDACVPGQPRRELAQGGLVDPIVGGERASDRRDDAAVVADCGH